MKPSPTDCGDRLDFGCLVCVEATLGSRMAPMLARYAVLLAAVTFAAPAFAATRVELATVGPDFAIWVVDTDGAAVVGVTVDDGSATRDAVIDTVKDRFHRARIDGLTPGRDHACVVRVDGIEVPAGPRSPATFRTLVPPGEPVFRFATVTDTHVGETVAGLVGGMDYKGFSWPDPALPYWRFTNEAAVREISAAGVEFVIHKGDLTAEAAPDQVQTARAIFDALVPPWHPLRGNHDRPHDGADSFVTGLGLAKTWGAFDAHGHRFLLLDSSDADGNPIMDETQLEWVESELHDAGVARRPTWVVLHHAVTEQASPLYTLWGDSRDRVLAAIAAASPAVVGVLSGHSHRNVRLASDTAPGVPFVETASTKEYPGMWTEVRVYTGGWMQIAHPIDCPECREWYATTTGEYDGSAPEMQMGVLEDRCFVVVFDPSLQVASGEGSEPGEEAGDAASQDATTTPEASDLADSSAAEDASLPAPGSGSCAGQGHPARPGPAGFLVIAWMGLCGLRRTRGRGAIRKEG